MEKKSWSSLVRREDALSTCEGKRTGCVCEHEKRPQRQAADAAAVFFFPGWVAGGEKKVNQRDGSSWLDMVVAKMLKEVFSSNDFEDEESLATRLLEDSQIHRMASKLIQLFGMGLFTSTVGRC